jgi:hypothetical protein
MLPAKPARKQARAQPLAIKPGTTVFIHPLQPVRVTSTNVSKGATPPYHGFQLQRQLGADSGRSQGHYRAAGVDPEPTFMTAPADWSSRLEFLEAEAIGYTIRLPANNVLQGRIGYLLKCLVGRPPHEVRRYYASFSYQA